MNTGTFSSPAPQHIDLQSCWYGREEELNRHAQDNTP